MAKEFDLSVVFKVVDKATKPVRDISRSFRQMAGPIRGLDKQLRSLGKSLQAAGKRMRDVGKSLSLKLTTPIVAFGGLSLKASMDFNKAMANVASLIPKNVARIQELKKEVQDMSLRTGKSTGIMAEGLYQVVSAFGDSAETAKILEINARASAAGLATVTDAVNLTSAVMKGYGDVSEAAAKKAADLAFQTVKLGQTTFPELAASIGRVTPLAAQLNLSQEQLFTGFATLTGVTGSAAEVSTQLAGALRALVKPTETMKKAFTALGYDSGKALLADKGLVGAFKVLFDLTGGNEQAMTEMFGRMEPLVAIFSLLGGQAETYTKKLEAMKHATGSMNEAFDEQTKGINKAGFIWDQFKIRLTILRQEIGDSLAPAFMKILSFLRPLIDRFSKLAPSTKAIILVVAALAAALGPLIFALGMIASGIGAIIAIGAPVIATIAGITAGIVALGVAIYGVVKYLGGPLKSLFNRLRGWGGFEPVMGPEGGGGAPALVAAGGEAAKSETDINLRLIADPGTSATIEKVRPKKGDAKVNVASVGYVGATAF